MKIRIIFFALLLATPWFIFSCNDKEAPATAAETPATPAINLDLIILTDLQYQNAGIALGGPETKIMGTRLELTGEVDLPPAGLINISVPYGGFLRKTALMPASPVRKGQVLAQLEHPD